MGFRLDPRLGLGDPLAARPVRLETDPVQADITGIRHWPLDDILVGPGRVDKMSVTKHKEPDGIIRYVRVRCNFCKKIIGEYGGPSKKDARLWAKADGARLHNDKVFCNDNCYWEYEDQQAQAAITGTADPEDPK